VGVTPAGPVKANSGVRARVPAAGNVLEGDDEQMTNKSTCIILRLLLLCK